MDHLQMKGTLNKDSKNNQEMGIRFEGEPVPVQNMNSEEVRMRRFMSQHLAIHAPADGIVKSNIPEGLTIKKLRERLD